jgi:hypothetical protein
LEKEVREPEWGRFGGLAFALGLGMLLALGCLTRYAFGWILIPLLVFLVLFGGKQRILLALTVVVTFAVILMPWIIRNYHLSGAPFGTATYAILEGNEYIFVGNHLQRSLDPDLGRFYHQISNLNLGQVLMPFWLKLINSLRAIVQNDLPKLGGTWLSAFFLVGLLVHFRNLAIRRLRYFLLMCLGVFVLAQAMGRTGLSEDSPEVNSENLLVLLTPFVIVYGVSLFFLLLDLIELPLKGLRYLIIGVFAVVACLPLILVFLPPKTVPVSYPPYYPPLIQQVGTWTHPDELIMSDIPWAVAWYGDRQSVWLTLKCTPDPKDPNPHENFFELNDNYKPVAMLYLTPETLDTRFVSQWNKAGERSWGAFIIEILITKKVPQYFPLREMPAGYFPEQLILSDWQRWRLMP